MSTPPPCSEVPAIGDGRPPVAALLEPFEALAAAGWRSWELAEQGPGLPIRAYASREPVDWIVLAGIHGREPAGAAAVARFAPRLAELGRQRGILLLPLCNPWGYHQHQRYGPAGQSVSDSDHLLGRAGHPACPEAAAITAFVMDGIAINPGAAVLDLHEDPVYEAEGYQLEGRGSYLYVTGAGAVGHPAAQRVADCLMAGPLPLIRTGVTRFGETLADGVIVDSEDGSIDELLARRRACSPVITVENLLRGPQDPPLPLRVATYLGVLDAFFGA